MEHVCEIAQIEQICQQWCIVDIAIYNVHPIGRGKRLPRSL
jgi:hypothetical protein